MFYLGNFNLKGKCMRTRKGGADPLSLLRVSKKSYDANETDCVDFFNNHPLYLPQNKKKWNSFIEANKLGKDKMLSGDSADEITDDYDKTNKQFCGKRDIVEKIRFPGSFRKGTGINYTLSLNGGKRRKRTKRSK